MENLAEGNLSTGVNCSKLDQSARDKQATQQGAPILPVKNWFNVFKVKALRAYKNALSRQKHSGHTNKHKCPRRNKKIIPKSEQVELTNARVCTRNTKIEYVLNKINAK